MGTQSVSNLNAPDLCRRVDEWLACSAGRYITYDRYRVGPAPDIRGMGKVVRLRHSVCGVGCGLCDDEKRKLMEYVNKLVL